MINNLKIKKNILKTINTLNIPIRIIIKIFFRIIRKILLEIDVFLYLKNGKEIQNSFYKKNDKKKQIFASFTQTYGNDRSLEIKLLKYDNIGKYIRKKCKYIVFSFRDCSEISVKNSIKFLEEIFPKEKLIFVENNSITYKESLLRSFKKIKSLGVTDIVFIQDDMYGLNNNLNQNYKEVIDTIFKGYRNLQLKWLHLRRCENLNSETMSQKVIQVGSIKFHEYLTKDFKKNTLAYSWNDGTFLADLDFLLTLYINIGFYVKDSPWLTEYMIKQLMDKYNFSRYGIDKQLFDSALIHGRNTLASGDLVAHLFLFFPKESNKDEFLSLINKHLLN